MEPRFDHPPANEALRSPQGQQAEQPISEFWQKIALILEDGQGNHEPIAEHHSHLPVEKLNPVNWLKPLNIDILIDCLKLDGLLVFVELYSPLLLIFRVSLCVWTPICHAKARMGEPRVSSEYDHP